MKWKSFDLNIFNSNIVIPDKYVIPDNGNFKILHATSLKNREKNNKNIKGSQYIFDAIAKLKSEGYRCELIFIDNVQSKEMKYFQVQADLIIDQLIYGHWGSSALEGVALGKPVICYFNKEWKNNYIKNFSIESWPFIEANTASIYSVIKNLLDNPNLLLEHSKLSKDFATKHLDIEVNVKEFVKYLELI
jgi:glycosyltransferase involved in cell wall biosynthesis